MELREWLIILGLALVTLIVVDGVRRLQRQRRIPRLDEVEKHAQDQDTDPEEEARKAEINWELPNGGARVVRPADYDRVQPKPKLQRQDHPGPSRVLSDWKASGAHQGEPEMTAAESASRAASPPTAAMSEPAAAATRPTPAASESAPTAAEPTPAVTRPTSTAPESAPMAAEPTPVATEPTPTASSQDIPASEESEDEVVGRDAGHPGAEEAERREPTLGALDEAYPSPAMSQDESKRNGAVDASSAEPLAADPRDHEDVDEDERYRLVDFDGVGDSLKSNSKRMGVSVQRFGASLQKGLAERREQKRLDRIRRDEEKARKAADDAERRRQAQAEEEAARLARDAERQRLESEAASAEGDGDPLFAPQGSVEASDAVASAEQEAFEASRHSDKVRVHPVLEKALRHDVSAEHARLTLSQAEEIIVISVMAREEEGFSGTALLDLMLACGLRYEREMGIFHRFETEDPESRLQFSMVNVVKPGTFPIEAIDDFRTPGVTLLMPLPGAEDCGAAFEAMVETAMVVVRHLGGELKDEHQSVMTAQTVEFARQRVQDFVRRNRLHRYQVN